MKLLFDMSLPSSKCSRRWLRSDICDQPSLRRVVSSSLCSAHYSHVERILPAAHQLIQQELPFNQTIQIRTQICRIMEKHCKICYNNRHWMMYNKLNRTIGVAVSLLIFDVSPMMPLNIHNG